MLIRTKPVPVKTLGLITYTFVELLFSDSGASMRLAEICSQKTAHPKSGVFNDIVILWLWGQK
jgi:hypothetical protein